MSTVLVVDDEPQLLRAMRINLRARGHDVHIAANGRQALAQAAAHRPDIVILDLGLPDMDGVEVIHGLRGWSTAPIIVLSGRTAGRAKVAALDAGADDYVTKPFGINELLARMRAVGRRVPSADQAEPVVVVGDFRIDLPAHRVSRADDPHTEVRLTPTEWRMLEALIRHPGKLVSQRQLLIEVCGRERTQETSYLRLYLAQLRRKLERNPSRPRHLITEPGTGYRFQP